MTLTQMLLILAAICGGVWVFFLLLLGYSLMVVAAESDDAEGVR